MMLNYFLITNYHGEMVYYVDNRMDGFMKVMLIINYFIYIEKTA